MTSLTVTALTVIVVAAALQFGQIPGLTELVTGTKALARETAPAGSPAESPGAVPDPTAAQQQQLIKREADLQTREAGLKERETQVADMLKTLSVQRTDADSVRRVADIYAAMPPYKAGPIIQALGADEAVGILRLLDQDQAAAILAHMDAARGSQLTSQLLKSQGQQANP